MFVKWRNACRFQFHHLAILLRVLQIEWHGILSPSFVDILKISSLSKNKNKIKIHCSLLLCGCLRGSNLVLRRSRIGCSRGSLSQHHPGLCGCCFEFEKCHQWATPGARYAGSGRCRDGLQCSHCKVESLHRYGTRTLFQGHIHDHDRISFFTLFNPCLFNLWLGKERAFLL